VSTLVDPAPTGGRRAHDLWDLARRHRVRSALVLAVFLLLVIAVVAPLRRGATIVLSKVILVATAPFAPDVSGLDTFPQGSRVIAADGSDMGIIEQEHRQPVTLDQLPPYVPKAILAAEDADFYSHDGVNPGAIVRAAFNMASGSGTQGGSTITQQLAKLNYTAGDRTLARKLKEVLYSSKLEQTYTKDQLLQRYLNQVYLGDGAYGIEAAAQRTYGIPAAKLTPEQAAAMAVRIRSPERLSPRKDPEGVRTRRDAVLDRMADKGWLPKPEADTAKAVPVGAIPLPADAKRGVNHIFDLVVKEGSTLQVLGRTPEERAARLYSGGMTIQLTIDPKAQHAAADAVAKVLPAPESPTAALASVEPGDGAIRALIGNSKGQPFDVAVDGRRQPGSSFKPLTYIAAIENGIDPDTPFESKTPQSFKYQGTDYTVNNAEPGNGGMMTMNDGLVESVNVVYAQVVLRAGPDKVVDVAKRLGYSEPMAPDPAIALGGLKTGVSPLEEAAAYASFANRGEYAAPYVISKLHDDKHRLVYVHEKKTHEAISRERAGVLNAVMQRVVTEGTGKAAKIGRPVAGKTGTTNDSVDAWFVGYTPQLSTAVWIGHPEGAVPMTDARGRGVFGGGPPAQIFAAMMTAALDGTKPLPLETATKEQIGFGQPAPAQAVAPPPPPAGADTTLPLATLPPTTATTQPPNNPTPSTIPTQPTAPPTTKKKDPKPCPTTTTSTTPGPTTTSTTRRGEPTTTTTQPAC
jgi:penicillin-binding protein 1A